MAEQVLLEKAQKPPRRIWQIFKTKTAKAGIILLLAVLVIIILGLLNESGAVTVTGQLNLPPSYSHPFGTDYLGRDLLGEIGVGAVPSFFIAFIGAFGSMILGLFAGVLAGYFGKLDGILSGTGDTILALPNIPFMIIVGTIFYPSDLLIAGLLVLVLWPIVSRVIRAQAMSVKTLAYVESAKMSGMKDRNIVLRIIIPEVAPIAIAYFILNIPLAVIITTALEFLGLGNPAAISWGSILYWAQIYAFYVGAWWWFLAPGVMITLVAMGFALFGFSLEEVFNPRLRTE